MLTRFVVPLSAFISTYYQPISGVFGGVGGIFERPFQAFMGTFLSEWLIDILAEKSGMSMGQMAWVALYAAGGAMLAGTLGAALGFGGQADLISSLGAAVGAHFGLTGRLLPMNMPLSAPS